MSKTFEMQSVMTDDNYVNMVSIFPSLFSRIWESGSQYPIGFLVLCFIALIDL